jgi:U3 small nucleolar RNA-associated protein 12
VGVNEEVLTWDIKKGDVISRWNLDDNHAQVTVITRCDAAPELIAVGYADGRIRIWDSVTATVIITFNGHKSSITQLAFDRSGGRLASGSRDTDIILWDLVAEVGLYRLRGHKDQITALVFLNTPALSNDDGAVETDSDSSYLLSASKDALIKVWDLSSQHCVETQVAQTNGECWTLGLSPDGTVCISAGNDGELRIWSVNLPSTVNCSINGIDAEHKVLIDRGTFYRQGKGRTIAVTFHPKRDLVAVHGSEKAIELLRIRSEAEIRKAMTRKRKRRRDKTDADSTQIEEEAQDDNMDISTTPITEVIVPYNILRTGGKVRSIDWAGGKSGKSVSILVSTTNNQLEVFEVATQHSRKGKTADLPDYSRTISVDMPGHRSDIRCLALSSDDRMLASASHGSLKIWNARTQSCLRTLDCGYALCSTFLPGDKIVVLGTREGTLELFDIASSTLIDTIQAHEKDVWALQVSPDGKSLITGSADKSAKFWDFRVIQEEVLGTTRKTPKLTLVHTRTLQVADDILALRISPDSRLLAVSTLDNTVKVFFMDTLKLYLTLYGHKLPVLSISISYDSKLLITSSADKNVRIWGLDFGDCHKTLFAHSDSILSVAFIPDDSDGNGHHFFSSSKDGTIKYFDGDKFEQIQKLTGHHSEIWAMAVANSGQIIVTASHDKSIRIWTQTDEQIFLEEEREKELEELYESALLTSLENDERNTTDASATEDVINDASKQTTQTLMAGEKIAEALTLAIEDLAIVREHEKLQATNPKARLAAPQRSLVFTVANAISSSTYVLQTFERIPAASLHDALLVLSFSQLPSLFTFLGIWAEEGRNISLTVRVLLFMLKVHQKQIVSSRLMRNELEDLRQKLRGTLNGRRKEVGFNLAGLRILGRKLGEIEDDRGWIDDVDVKGAESEEQRKKGAKRTFVNVA